MTTWDWILLSGIPSSHPGGTGQMMRHLESEVLAARRFDGTIMYSPDGESLTEDQLQLLTEASKVILFHPQMLGVAEVLRLIELRRRARRVTSMYLLDSFFFCRRSYNHIDQEWTPCLRCIGTNRSHEADRMGCSPWPKVSPGASEFAIRIGELVSAGAVSLIAQTETQRELAHRHFGQSAAIGVAGLWCEDWQEHFDHFESFGVDREQDGTFDVVYHGSRDLAKGLGWVLTVAAALPHLSFLVPLDRGNVTFTGPANATIRPMRWDDGLFAAIKGAKMTLVPSLWSAPCEGALIKSIVTAPAVCPAPLKLGQCPSSEYLGQAG